MWIQVLDEWRPYVFTIMCFFPFCFEVHYDLLQMDIEEQRYQIYLCLTESLVDLWLFSFFPVTYFFSNYKVLAHSKMKGTLHHPFNVYC